MRLIKSPVLLAVVGSLVGCIAAKDSKRASVGSTAKATATCAADQELMSLGLQAGDLGNDGKSIAIPALDGSLFEVASGDKVILASGKNTVQIDYCTDFFSVADVLSVKVTMDGQKALVYSADQVVKSEGLLELSSMMDNNFKLELKNPTDSESFHIVTVAGSAVMFRGTSAGAKLKVTEKTAVAGRFAAGIPTADCFDSTGNGELSRWELKTPEVEARFESCTNGPGRMGTSGTQYFYVKAAEITDLRLAAAGKTKTVRLERDDMQIQVNHHNSCDSLVIKSQGTVYGFMNAVDHAFNAKDCKVLAGAPQPPNGTQPKFGLYKFTYADGHISEGASAKNRIF